MDVVAVAQRLADETLFPAARETDRSEVVPVELLDALADAGLYGLTGPASAGGLEAEFPSMLAVIEAIDSGCLTTAFVWTQHLGCVRDAAASANEEVRALVPRMCSGELRSGLALGGAHAGRPQLHARPDGGGWVLNGVSPFVSGWGRIDVMHAAARTDDGRLVWSFLDAAEGDTIRAERLDLVALNATATVRLELREHRVPSSMVSSGPSSTGSIPRRSRPRGAGWGWWPGARPPPSWSSRGAARSCSKATPSASPGRRCSAWSTPSARAPGAPCSPCWRGIPRGDFLHRGLTREFASVDSGVTMNFTRTFARTLSTVLVLIT